MSSSLSTTVGGVVVVTHVHPAPQGAVPKHPVGIQKFSRASPMALGTVQIMIGLMTLLFGIVMVVQPKTGGVYSGIFAWGAVIHITAGSLTVAAGKSLNRCLVNGALGVSVLSAVVSCIATILHSVDATGPIICDDYQFGRDDCFRYETLSRGNSGVLAVFSFLELIVSITVAGYGCCASYSAEESSVVVVTADASLTARALSSAPLLTDGDLTEEPNCLSLQPILQSSAEESV
ncbi:membrane-spanning 4-domains subfamily A member 12-like [Lates calcarifer]|uniref:Membrane-spanning 4-domains subfamily A member 12-like n=1 Tax=Lates calcarifer TaxID=8187 RepID=A0AAJ7PDB7_LATCA|nr:membrane-spanning 4-domains subfamily A member 12-like [Lates calcarifer]